MAAQYQGNERRKFNRAYVQTDLFYCAEYSPAVETKTKGKSETAALVDLGEGGIAFVCRTELAKDTKIQVAFELNTQEGKRIKVRALCIVRYCFLQGDYKSYRIGLEFVKIDRAAKQAIIAFVRDFQK